MLQKNRTYRKKKKCLENKCMEIRLLASRFLNRGDTFFYHEQVILIVLRYPCSICTTAHYSQVVVSSITEISSEVSTIRGISL